jgi:hypothetical protein
MRYAQVPVLAAQQRPKNIFSAYFPRKVPGPTGPSPLLTCPVLFTPFSPDACTQSLCSRRGTAVGVAQKVKSEVVLWTALFVLTTLVVNAPTLPFFLSVLGLNTGRAPFQWREGHVTK